MNLAELFERHIEFQNKDFILIIDQQKIDCAIINLCIATTMDQSCTILIYIDVLPNSNATMLYENFLHKSLAIACGIQLKIIFILFDRAAENLTPFSALSVNLKSMNLLYQIVPVVMDFDHLTKKVKQNLKIFFIDPKIEIKISDIRKNMDLIVELNRNTSHNDIHTIVLHHGIINLSNIIMQYGEKTGSIYFPKKYINQSIIDQYFHIFYKHQYTYAEQSIVLTLKTFTKDFYSFKTADINGLKRCKERKCQQN